jgi:hypothetical protein
MHSCIHINIYMQIIIKFLCDTDLLVGF